MENCVKRILVIRYSQSGQTARALETLLVAMAAAHPSLQVEQIDLQAASDVARRYPLPWSLMRFIRAPADVFFPLQREPGQALDAARYDVVVIAYPVWFLSPAAPVLEWLAAVPPGGLAGARVITLSTSRKMWFRAQTQLRAAVDSLAGRVVTHISLQDPSGNLASMLTTLRFFLTSRRQFQSKLLRRVAPEFGIGPAQYEEFARWLSTAGSGPLDRMPSYYRFDEPLALAESIGIRIFRWLYALWPKAERLGPVVERLYVSISACATAAAIALLMPPTLIFGRLPPVRRWVRKAEAEILSTAR